MLNHSSTSRPGPALLAPPPRLAGPPLLTAPGQGSALVASPPRPAGPPLLTFQPAPTVHERSASSWGTRLPRNSNRAPNAERPPNQTSSGGARQPRTGAARATPIRDGEGRCDPPSRRAATRRPQGATRPQSSTFIVDYLLDCDCQRPRIISISSNIYRHEDAARFSTTHTDITLFHPGSPGLIQQADNFNLDIITVHIQINGASRPSPERVLSTNIAWHRPASRIVNWSRPVQPPTNPPLPAAGTQWTRPSNLDEHGLDEDTAIKVLARAADEIRRCRTPHDRSRGLRIHTEMVLNNMNIELGTHGKPTALLSRPAQDNDQLFQALVSLCTGMFGALAVQRLC